MDGGKKKEGSRGEETKEKNRRKKEFNEYYEKYELGEILFENHGKRNGTFS